MTSNSNIYWRKDLLKAEDHIRKQKYSDAKKILDELSKLENDDCSASALRLLGKMALEQKSFNEAKDIFDSLVQKITIECNKSGFGTVISIIGKCTNTISNEGNLFFSKYG